MLKRVELLNEWFYNDCYEPSMCDSTSVEGFLKVQLPHANKELPYHYFDETDFQFVSCYKRFIEIPDITWGQIVKIRFEGVMTYASVYFDGFKLGEHKGGYTPFEFVIDNALLQSGETAVHCLTVVVDSTERADIPPFGGQIDYLTYGGIYREVSLDIYAPVYIQNAQIKTDKVLTKYPTISSDLYIENTLQQPIIKKLQLRLLDVNRNLIASTEEEFTLPTGTSVLNLSLTELEGLELWSIDSPHLYFVNIHLDDELFETRIGLREATFRPDGFYLNGEKIQIRGLNRHQSWPYVGYAMPKRAQEKDADILKYDLHLNLVRTSHYPQSIHFLNRCDEIGLLVFEEIPGWQHIGNLDWQNLAVKHVEEMILRDWNHPSVILWGVRINESPDHHEFYEKTNACAKELDSTRQTGGVRCIENSELLEDVYTMNDFAHEGGDIVLREQQVVTKLAKKVPYMVTEYNGHMYPTKKQDNEERQMEHVLRHLRVQNAAYEDPYISGAIGWCAFDYNTHKDFGAGDRICYHGIMDMFRIKKFAAYAYKSQVDPSVEPVLRPVTYWARGERSIGGILPLILLTNCDSVTVQFGDSEPIPVKRKVGTLEGLPYPPIIIDDTDIPPSKLGEWGMKWEDGIIKGYVKDTCVIEYPMSKAPVPSKLSVVADDLELRTGAKDVTRVIVSILDQFGNVLPFADTDIHVQLDPISRQFGRIQGPDRFSLKGGSFGFYVESYGLSGEGAISLTVRASGFEEVLSIQVKGCFR